LQSAYVFKMEQQIGTANEKEIEEELKRKREITFANHVVDEVKVYVRCSLHFMFLMYKDAFIDEDDLKVYLHEDLIKMIINSLF